MNDIIKKTNEIYNISYKVEQEEIYETLNKNIHLINIRKKVPKRLIQNKDILSRVDSENVVVLLVSLGNVVDNLIKTTSEQSAYKGYVMDCMASIICEEELNKLSSFKVFCLGYNGTLLSGNLELSKLINANKYGIIVSEFGTITPRKSTIGFEFMGNFSCDYCVKLAECKRVIKCYE